VIACGVATRSDDSPRGAALFEVLLSIALFVGAASFTLGAMRSSLNALDRRAREALAMDLARSKMAELETGMITVNDLREDASGIDSVGSFHDLSEDARLARWRLDVQTSPSEHAGLRLVTITVRDGEAEVDADVVSATLRQLVALREGDEGWYEEDEMLRGLPSAPESGSEEQP